MIYKQRRHFIILLSALSVFISSFTAFLSTHTDWDSFWSPKDVAQLIVMISTFIFTIFGALHYQLPRDPALFHHDRHTDALLPPQIYLTPVDKPDNNNKENKHG